MAQNFWPPFCLTALLLVTIRWSLVTRAHEEAASEVWYSLTERAANSGLPWYQRPVILGVVALRSLRC